ncbi:MAG: tetratricopeptide repeat protein, partial [Desulfobulbia bacterium]
MKTLKLRRNHRLASTLATNFLVVIFALMPIDAALAKDTDCFKKTGDVQIKACTRIIKKKRVYGKRISKKNLAITHNHRGIAYYNKGQFDKAIADYKKAIQLNPKDAAAYYRRGNAFSAK